MSARASVPLFGDLLALARQRWIQEMAARLEERGHPGYRRSDALVLRRLRRGPVPVGRLAGTLGISRQAARKVVDGLERRGFAATERDAADARRLNVVLTTMGAAYATEVVAVLASLNDDVEARLEPSEVQVARTVLSEIIARYGSAARAGASALD